MGAGTYQLLTKEDLGRMVPEYTPASNSSSYKTVCYRDLLEQIEPGVTIADYVHIANQPEEEYYYGSVSFSSDDEQNTILGDWNLNAVSNVELENTTYIPITLEPFETIGLDFSLDNTMRFLDTNGNVISGRVISATLSDPNFIKVGICSTPSINHYLATYDLTAELDTENSGQNPGQTNQRIEYTNGAKQRTVYLKMYTTTANVSSVYFRPSSGLEYFMANHSLECSWSILITMHRNISKCIKYDNVYPLYNRTSRIDFNGWCGYDNPLSGTLKYGLFGTTNSNTNVIKVTAYLSAAPLGSTIVGQSVRNFTYSSINTGLAGEEFTHAGFGEVEGKLVLHFTLPECIIDKRIAGVSPDNINTRFDVVVKSWHADAASTQYIAGSNTINFNREFTVLDSNHKRSQSCTEYLYVNIKMSKSANARYYIEITPYCNWPGGSSAAAVGEWEE